MRNVIDLQMKLGEAAISAIELDPESRDDIPQLLRGLQHIYTTPELRERVFTILKQVRPERPDKGAAGKADPNNGRPGMEQWKILVLGVLRLGLNADYDRIQELANQHHTVRQMLGHGEWEDPTRYRVQTLKDNLRLFTPEILDRINREVVGAGHQVLKKSADEGINARCDSFVVETDIHYPTDTNLLLDAIRKTIESGAALAKRNGLPGWRQHAYHQRQFKKSYRKIQRLRHSTAKDENQRQQKEAAIHDAHRAYLELAERHLAHAEQTGQALPGADLVSALLLCALDGYMGHARRQISQIDRRVLRGERIADEEKIFSIFEPHSEWICKGKAGVAVELGLRVCVMEDSDRFILHHQVMEKTTDDRVAVSMVDATKERVSRKLRAVSMDKGFHSPANQVALKERLERVILPKKGRLSRADRAREHDPEFIHLRHRHSAVESAINALESHGLDRCPDHGMGGFKRYVAMAVVARNIQRLGAVLRQQQQARERRKRGPYKKAA